MKNNPIKRMKISEMVPSPYNPRKISKEKMEMLKKSLEEFGDTQIVTWNQRTGRRCFGLEIDPGYCDVIVKRWENFAGRKAECISAT